MVEVTPFGERLLRAVRERGTPACVGLDPFPDRVPGVVPGAPREAVAEAVRAFCLRVIEAVAPIVPVVKPQSALFEQLGPAGVAALVQVVQAARDAGLLVIVDGKRGDIGSTADAYARAQLDADGPMNADAVTVSPYPGPESLTPYLARTRAGKGVFVLVRTSNPGAEVWQRDVALAIARHLEAVAAVQGRGLGSVGAVVGATVPSGEVEALRAAMPGCWWLVPGFGAQGAGPDEIRPHFLPDGTGALITSSRAVLYPASGFDRDGDVAGAVAERARAFADSVAAAAP
jgi:orotidine-5'-phosphate decarboxylase